MNLNLKLFINSASQLASRLISAFSLLIVTYLITNNLSKEIWGDFITVTSYLALFTILSDFGLNGIVVKKIHQEIEKESEYFRQLLGLRLVLSIVSIFLALAFLAFLPHSFAVKTGIIVGSLLIVFQAFFNSASVAFQSKGRYDLFLFSDVVGSFFILLLMFLVVQLKLGLLTIILVFLVGNLVKALLGLIFARNLIKFTSFGINMSVWRSLLITSFPLGLMVALSQINANIDKQILSLSPSSAFGGLSAAVAVGIYGLAYRGFDFAISLPTYFVNSAYPLMLESHKKDKVLFVQEIKRLALVLFGGGVLLSLVGWFLAPVVINIFGDYQASVAPLQILLLGLPFFFVTSLLLWVSVTLNKEVLLPFIYGFGLLVNLVLNLIFIPKYGYNAAAWVTLVSEGVILIGLLAILNDLGILNLKRSENAQTS